MDVPPRLKASNSVLPLGNAFSEAIRGTDS